jgi:DNA-binding CsgD family transcriptional regulator
LSERLAADRIRVAVVVADPALAGRVTSALMEVADLELVSAGAAADVRVVEAGEAQASAGPEVAFTARELEVLALLAEGASNKLIARQLGISTHTAKYHVASLLDKLDAVSRTDAVAHAARLGVIHL